MKFSTYDPTVKTNNIQGEIRVPADRAAWGISTNSLDDAGKAIRSIGLAIGQRQEEADRQTILKAMNLYNQGQYGLMYNAEDGLMNTKLEGSDGIDGTYLSRERELRSNVLGVTKLHDKKNMLALTNLMDKSAMQGFQAVDRHRQQQYEKVQDIHFEGNMNNVLDSALANPETIDDQLLQAKRLVDLRYGGKNLGDEAMKSIYRQQGGRVIIAVIENAMTTENYPAAREILEIYGKDYMDEKQRLHYSQSIYKMESNRWEMQTAKELAEMYGDDPLAITEHVNGMTNGFQGLSEEGGTWQRSNESVSLSGLTPTAQAAISDIAQVYSELSGGKLTITSGTDSTDIHASGENSHASGMKIDVASEFLENPENRKKFISIAESKGIKVLDEYENPSANSTGRHLDLNLSGYKGSGRRMPPEQAERIRQEAIKYGRELEAFRKHRQNAKREAFWKELYNDIINTNDNPNMKEVEKNALKKCRQFAGYNTDEYNKGEAYVKDLLRIKYQTSDRPEMTNADFVMLKRQLINDPEIYKDDSMNFIQVAESKFNLNKKDYDKLVDTYWQWRNRVGEFAINLDNYNWARVLGARPKDLAAAGEYDQNIKALKRWASYAIPERIEKKKAEGLDPEINDIELTNMLRAASQEHIMGYYKTGRKTFFGSDEVKPLWYSDMEGAKVGIRVAVKEKGDDMYYIDFEQTDQTKFKGAKLMNVERLAMLLANGFEGNTTEQEYALMQNEIWQEALNKAKEDYLIGKAFEKKELTKAQALKMWDEKEANLRDYSFSEEIIAKKKEEFFNREDIKGALARGEEPNKKEKVYFNVEPGN